MFNRKLKKRLARQDALLRAAVLLLSQRDNELAALKYWLSQAQADLIRLNTEASNDSPVEPEITFAAQPLYLSEDEEDIQWQYDQELINVKQYEALLKELEFQNSEVQLAEEPMENFHY